MKGYEGSLNNHSKQFGGSAAKGGQVEIHHTAEGDRRQGIHDARGQLSPLGGRSHPDRDQKQIYEEKKNRAQSPQPISRSGVLDRFHSGKSGPI